MDEALDDGVDSSGDALSRSSKPEFVGSASDEVFSRCHTECDGEAQEDSFDLMRGIANPICGPDANEPAPLPKCTVSIPAAVNSAAALRGNSPVKQEPGQAAVS